MAVIIPIETNMPHATSEVICVKCGYRWLSVRPEITRLRELECPSCGKQGYVIETGEIIKEESV